MLCGGCYLLLLSTRMVGIYLFLACLFRPISSVACQVRLGLDPKSPILVSGLFRVRKMRWVRNRVGFASTPRFPHKPYYHSSPLSTKSTNFYGPSHSEERRENATLVYCSARTTTRCENRACSVPINICMIWCAPNRRPDVLIVLHVERHDDIFDIGLLGTRVQRSFFVMAGKAAFQIATTTYSNRLRLTGLLLLVFFSCLLVVKLCCDKVCLKYVVLANMLALSDINPFAAREAKV